jgi:hypothetical protein
MVFKTLTVVFLIFALHLGGFSHGAPAQSPASMFDGSEVLWNRLTFESDNFLGTVNTRVELEELPADAVEGRLITSPQGVSLEPSGGKVLLLTVNSTIDPLLGPDELVATRVWFSPQDASALQRIRVRQGKEKWEKTYRWTQNGVYRRRLRPQGADEEKLPLARWTNREDSFYPYDLDASNCLSVAEPSALLYVVSAAELAVGGQPLNLCVFNKKQLHLVRIQVIKSQLLKINYLEKSQHKETRRKGKVDVLQISFTTRSLFADEAKAEPFSFLGLKGDFDIFVDKVSKIPVQISGKIPAFGRVDFKLGEVQMRPQ